MRREQAQRVQELHERHWADELERARGKGVLLVEGDDDQTTIEAFLARRGRSWPTRIHVVVAGSRSNVIDRLRTTFPDGFGLVDRDVWTDGEAQAAVDRSGKRLFVTEGWCLESSLLAEPGEGLNAEIQRELDGAREAWVRAGALWWCLQRTREAVDAWQGLVGWRYGRPHPELALGSGPELLASLETMIPQPAREAARLDLDQVAQRFAARLEEVFTWDARRQWRCGVHGKSAFQQVLVPLLNQHLGQREAVGWRTFMAKNLDQIPPPVDAMIAALLP